ncbi:MAG: tetratricopeptide repeat protein [Phycisphaerae bacterium]
MNNTFVEWDDYDNLVNNPHIRVVSVDNVRWMLKTDLLGVWQPLSWLVTTIEYRCLGGDDPASFRSGLEAVSIGLHAIAAILCFFIVAQLTLLVLRDRPALAPTHVAIGATASSLFFALHPLRAEVVAWASGQPYLLATIGCLAATACYLRAVDTARRRWHIAALLCLTAGLLCKSIAVSLVAVWLLLDIYPLRRFRRYTGGHRATARGVLLEKLPYVAVSVAAVVLAYRANLATADYRPEPLAVQALITLFCLGWYAMLTFVPAGIAPFYARPHPAADILTNPWLLGAVLAGILLTIAAVHLRRRRPGLLVAWLGHAVIVLPTTGWVPHGGQMAADRYAYLPGIVWAALLAPLITLAWAGRRTGRHRHAIRALTVVLITAVLIGLTARTRVGCRVWHDSIALWTAMVERNPGWPNGPYQLAKLHNARGDPAAAERFYRHALEIYPGYPEANVNLGILLQSRGDLQAARLHYRRALQERPGFHMAHYNLACLLIRQSRYAEALHHLERAEADAVRTDSSKLPIIRGRLREIRPLANREGR